MVARPALPRPAPCPCLPREEQSRTYTYIYILTKEKRQRNHLTPAEAKKEWGRAGSIPRPPRPPTPLSLRPPLLFPLLPLPELSRSGRRPQPGSGTSIPRHPWRKRSRIVHRCFLLGLSLRNPPPQDLELGLLVGAVLEEVLPNLGPGTATAHQRIQRRHRPVSQWPDVSWYIHTYISMYLQPCGQWVRLPALFPSHRRLRPRPPPPLGLGDRSLRMGESPGWRRRLPSPLLPGFAHSSAFSL